jgi:hypothetical protein
LNILTLLIEFYRPQVLSLVLQNLWYQLPGEWTLEGVLLWQALALITNIRLNFIFPPSVNAVVNVIKLFFFVPDLSGKVKYCLWESFYKFFWLIIPREWTL